MSSHGRPARILIVDDHPMVREGMTLRLSAHPDLDVCGEAAGEDEALELVRLTEPDLVIVDISLGQGHGLDLVKRIKAKYPVVKVLVVSGFDESLYAERALRAGAAGYLDKRQSGAKVIEAVRAILAGNRYMSPELAERLVSQALGGRDMVDDPILRLTDRELEIFRLIGSGLTSGAIAGQLHLSTHTIDTHRENIKRKLGTPNAAELNRRAVQWVLENS
jgi:DNA-binding NarL/FixJ family response regulator